MNIVIFNDLFLINIRISTGNKYQLVLHLACYLMTSPEFVKKPKLFRQILMRNFKTWMTVALTENISWNLLWFFNVYVNYELNHNIFFPLIVFILPTDIAKKNTLLNTSSQYWWWDPFNFKLIKWILYTKVLILYESNRYHQRRIKI